jgi:sulfate permease, SulP family
VISRPGDISPASVLVGVGAIAILGVLARTPFSSAAALVALMIPTLVAALLGASTVLTVADGGDIPRGLPLPGIPDLSLFTLNLVTGALAVTAIVLVQGACVGETAPNPDGSGPGTNRDFVAQGAANVAAGLFKGQPVGGSVGQTALNKTAGARSRWGSIFSGIWMMLILVAFSGLVGKVAMPTLAGVLIFAAVGSLRLGEIRTVLQTGRPSQIAVVTTFVATLFLSVAAAVGIGVALSLLLQLNRDALDLKVVRLIPRGAGVLEEAPAPRHLASREVILLDAYGSLLYAGSRTLQSRLPEVGEASEPVVVLRLRGRTALGATFFVVISDYARQLADAGGRLYLSGVGSALADQMRRSGSVDFVSTDQVVEATPVLGESSAAALSQGEEWLVAHPKK